MKKHYFIQFNYLNVYTILFSKKFLQAYNANRMIESEIQIII